MILSKGHSIANIPLFRGGGGGDILAFRKVTSEAFLIQQYHEYRPNSPSLEEDDYKFAFDIENKINTHDAESLEQQILADMMVTLSMSVDRMCQNCDVHLHSLKTISVYGLSLDHVVPLQLYKLRMNFEKKEVEVFRKVACKHGPIPSLTVDCLISYMIRNISECNM